MTTAGDYPFPDVGRGRSRSRSRRGGRGAARARGGAAPRGRARARAQVGRPGAHDTRAARRAVRRRAARGGRAQGGRARAARGPGAERRMNVVYLGTSAFASSVLERLAKTPYRPVLVVTRPDRPKGRGLKLAPPPVADKARELGIDVDQPQSVN